MAGPTLLRQMLEAVRTFDGRLAPPGGELHKRIWERDFYGSPLAQLGLATPFPSLPIEANSCWDVREGRSTPVRYPPHETVATNDDEFPYLDTWPLPSLPDDDGSLLRATIFLEVIRCIAAPRTDTDVARLELGVLAGRNRLPKDYFKQASGRPVQQQSWIPLGIAGHKTAAHVDDRPDRQRRLFRETILAVYTHVLLRQLWLAQPSFLNNLFAAGDGNARGEAFRRMLASNSDPLWMAAVEAAFYFVRRSCFEELFGSRKSPETHFLGGLTGLLSLPMTVSGRPPKRFKLKIPTRTTVPATLAAIIHFCPERPHLYADNRRDMADVLTDSDRISRADDLLHPERWVEFAVPAGDHQGGRTPSIYLAFWSNFCAVLEAVLAGVLSTTNLESPDAAMPEGIGENHVE